MIYYSASIIDHDEKTVQVKNVHNNNMSLLVDDTTFVKLSDRSSVEIRKALNEGKLVYILKSAIYPDSEVKISHISIKENEDAMDIEVEKRKAIHSLRLKYEVEANKVQLMDSYELFSANASLNVMNVYPTSENINELLKEYEFNETVLKLLISFKSKNIILSRLYETKKIIQDSEEQMRNCTTIEQLKETFKKCKNDVLKLGL